MLLWYQYHHCAERLLLSSVPEKKLFQSLDGKVSVALVSEQAFHRGKDVGVGVGGVGEVGNKVVIFGL